MRRETLEQREKHNAYMREYQKRNRAKKNTANQTYREANLERVRAWEKKARDKSKDRTANRILVKKYGITLDQYSSMFAAQGGKCRICERPNRVRQRLHVDHCHKTQRVRGLLCCGCNLRLGWHEQFAAQIATYTQG